MKNDSIAYFYANRLWDECKYVNDGLYYMIGQSLIFHDR